MKYLYFTTIVFLIQCCNQHSLLDKKFARLSWHQDLEEISNNDETTAEELFKLECVIRFYNQMQFFDTTKPITYRQLLGVGFNFHGPDEDGYIATGPKGVADFHLKRGATVLMENTETKDTVKFYVSNLCVKNLTIKPVVVSRAVLWSETIHGISLGSPVFEVNRIIEPNSTDTIQIYYDEPSILSSYQGAFPNSNFIADEQVFWDKFNLLLQQVNFDTLVDATKQYIKKEDYFPSGSSWVQVNNTSQN